MFLGARLITQFEEWLPIRVPVTGCDVGEVCHRDPAEIESILMPGVTKWECGSASTPCNVKAGRPLLDRAIPGDNLRPDMVDRGGGHIAVLGAPQSGRSW